MVRKRVLPKDEVAATAPMDSARDGSTPLNPSGGGGGGSVMRGDLITEATFLQPQPVTFVDSPFGQRYLSRKTRSLSRDDVVLRMGLWAFDVRGYHDYGAVTLDVPDALAVDYLLQDWYPLVRDMGKRNLKYKHLPLTITDKQMLRYWMNAYGTLVSNNCALLNLNRLAMVNTALSTVSALLPRYMSRLTRLWRRTSALSAPTLLKAHAIRNGMIPYLPNFCSPYVRFWSMEEGPILAAAAGGPTLVSMIGTQPYDWLTVDLVLGHFVSNLGLSKGGWRWVPPRLVTISLP